MAGRRVRCLRCIPSGASARRVCYERRTPTGDYQPSLRSPWLAAIANTTRKDNLARARELLMSKVTDESTDAVTNDVDTADSGNDDASATYVCPECGAPMLVIDIFLGGQLPRAPPAVSVGEP